MSAEGRLRQLEGEVRVLLAEIGKVTGGPVKPTEFVSNIAGRPGPILPGWTWRPTDGWSVHVCREGDVHNAVYIHSPADSFPGDVSPLWPDEARALAAALATAADAVDASHKLPVLMSGRQRPAGASIGTPGAHR